MQRIQILLALILSLNLITVSASFAAPTQSANQIISTSIPTSSIGGQPLQEETATQGRPPLGLTIFLLGFCCAFLLLIGVFILSVVVRKPNPKKDNNN